MRWLNERPDDNGTYWFKQPGMLPELLLVRDGSAYDFGDSEPTSIGFYDGRGEWLGPITAQQAEQFDALRKASEVALKWMDWWLDSELCECDGHGHICGKTERRREADALRRALGKQE